MNNTIPKLDPPVNINERYLYAISVRLDAIIHMMSSFMEYTAQKEGLATTANQIEDKVIAEKPTEVKSKKTKK